MKRYPAIAAATLLASLAATPAVAERLVTSISRHQVMVNSNFTGTSIVLFGTIEPDTINARRRGSAYDLVVTVTGPKQTIVARRKERVLGIWTNTASRTFVNVPSYLAVLATQPFDKFADDATLRKNHISVEHILLPEKVGPDIGNATDDPFRANFVRLKSEQGLYVQKTNGVTLLTPTVFRAEIPLTAEAPIGNYNVDIKVFADGALLSRANSAFEVIKVGFEQFVASAARDYGLLYGLTTTVMALMTGWFASVVFRRD